MEKPPSENDGSPIFKIIKMPENILWGTHSVWGGK